MSDLREMIEKSLKRRHLTPGGLNYNLSVKLSPSEPTTGKNGCWLYLVTMVTAILVLIITF